MIFRLIVSALFVYAVWTDDRYDRSLSDDQWWLPARERNRR